MHGPDQTMTTKAVSVQWLARCQKQRSGSNPAAIVVECPRSPTVEALVLGTSQCQFESDHGYMKNKKRIAQLEDEVDGLKTAIQFLEYRLACLEPGQRWWPYTYPIISYDGELPHNMV